MRRYGAASGQLDGEFFPTSTVLSHNDDILEENGDGEVDQHFWAQANQNGGDDIDQSEPCSPQLQYLRLASLTIVRSLAQGGGPIPFNTQFFHDDFDDGPGFDDDLDPDGGELVIPTTLDEEGDLLAATQGPLKRVRPEFVNYARKAKRVDVRKLKDNIWKGLKIMTPSDVEPGASSSDNTIEHSSCLTCL
jgi:condensin complex subunit 2